MRERVCARFKVRDCGREIARVECEPAGVVRLASMVRHIGVSHLHRPIAEERRTWLDMYANEDLI